MRRINTVIVDDEINSSDVIVAQIKRHFPNINIQAVFNNSTEAIQEIPKLEPDLLFLDIEMPNHNGFEVLDNIEIKSFETIFITAYNDFAIEAFKKNAIGYVLKPVDRSDFVQTVLMAILRISNQSPRMINSKVAVLNNDVKVALPTNGEQKILFLKDILYVKADGSYCSFITHDGEYLISKNLRHVEEGMLKHQFVRANRSFLVNTQHIQSLSKKDGGTLTMVNGMQISVSQRVKDDVFDSISDSIILL